MAQASRGRMDGLPGMARNSVIEPGDMCYTHEDRPSVFCVQGETDSFGCEYVHFCAECKDKYKADVKGHPDGEEGICDSCGSRDLPVRPWRDPDEGQAGPVYWQCAGCRTRRLDRERAELEQDMKDHPEDYEYDSIETGQDDIEDFPAMFLQEEFPDAFFLGEDAPDHAEVFKPVRGMDKLVAAVSTVSDFGLSAQMVQRRFKQRYPNSTVSVSDIKSIWVQKGVAHIKRRFATKGR